MVRRGMMLGEVVSEVVPAFAPMDHVLVLGDAGLDPIKTHVHGFGAALLDGVIDDAQCARIVSLYWRGSLRVSKFEQCDTERFLRYEKARRFRLQWPKTEQIS